ncbi:MAG: hypothetical protein KUG82_18630 [Pseudomonadales bacterium]|nr:hypothetical protein [Pseudomonadales bacterium]
MIKLIRKLKQFNKQIISSKTAILVLINRYVPTDMGSVIDLHLDRQNQTLCVEIEKNEAITEVVIEHYQVNYSAGRPILTWKQVKVKGSQSTAIRSRLAAYQCIPIPDNAIWLVDKFTHKTA